MYFSHMEEVDMTLLEMLILNKKKSSIIAVTGILAASLFIAGCKDRSAAVGNAQSAPPEVSVSGEASTRGAFNRASGPNVRIILLLR